jgi:hypothetical protein
LASKDAGLHKRSSNSSKKKKKGSSKKEPNGTDVPANALADAANAQQQALLSPQPQRVPSLRPVPPQQFRLRVSLANNGNGNGNENSGSPRSGRTTGSPAPSPSMSPLSALLRSPSPPHQFPLRDPSDPAGSKQFLASFRLGGRDIVINPLHVYLCEIPIKYFTYFSVGFNACAVCPLMFQWLQI